MLILLRQSTEYEILNYFNDMSTEIDAEVAAVKLIKSNIVLVSLYKSPDGNVETFIDTLSDLLTNVILIRNCSFLL